MVAAGALLAAELRRAQRGKIIGRAIHRGRCAVRRPSMDGADPTVEAEDARHADLLPCIGSTPGSAGRWWPTKTAT
jgi:hypothetical protein